jgi:hypothetical protein
MEDKKLVKADFVVSLVLILFSSFIIVQSFHMPKYATSAGFYAMPAMTPMVFGSLLLLLGLILFGRSLKAGGYHIRITRAQVIAVLHSEGVKRFSAVLGLVVVYFFLLGKINFVVVTAAFLFAMIQFFKGAKWWTSLIISTLTALIVWYVFNQIFLVPLP